jgi:hypothetical protein
VIDLRIEAGKIAAKVSGSSLYDIAIEIDAVKREAWRAIQRDCAGGIGSRLELLSGRLSEPVMARLCADRTGLFPAPSAIRFTCSCPDVATMCKHVAAAMYGIGARLDRAPELLFTLRRVALDELLAAAVTELPAAPAAARVLASDGLAALFGIELAEPAAPAPAAASPRARRASAPSPAPRARSTPPAPASKPKPKPSGRGRAAATAPSPRSRTSARAIGKPAARTAAAAKPAARPAAPRPARPTSRSRAGKR